MIAKVTAMLLMLNMTLSVLSRTGFSTGSDVENSNFKVLTNTTKRNKEHEGKWAVCEYLRLYVVRYHFEWKEGTTKHSEIYYKTTQCLDDKFVTLNDPAQEVLFSNNNGPDAVWKPLGEGCPPPVVPKRKKNLCENGVAIGDKLVKEVAKVFTAKIVDDPARLLDDSKNPGSGENDEGMVEMSKQLVDLEAKLAVALDNKTIEEMKHTEPRIEQGDEEGQVKAFYEYANGVKAIKVFKNGNVWQIIVIQPDNGDVLIDTYTPDLSSVVRVSTNSTGDEVYSTRHIERDFETGEETDTLIVPGNESGTEPTVIRRDIPVDAPRPLAARHSEDPNGKVGPGGIDLSPPIVFNFNPELWSEFSKTAETFQNIVSGYVKENVECLMNRIIKQHADYLTFVCANSSVHSIKDVLANEFGERVQCNAEGIHNCDELYDRLVDQMLDAQNKGEDPAGTHVKSDRYNLRLKKVE